MSIFPGSTIGILGGGQLGRMTAIEAAKLGYRTHVYDPSPDSPAFQVANISTTADFSDPGALEQFARSVDVITLEFENIPAASVDLLTQITPVHPSCNVLKICQNRLREKSFIRSLGISCPEFQSVASLEELRAAVEKIGFPCVLKTCELGYDGKGQVKISSPDEIDSAWVQWAGPNGAPDTPGILEQWVTFSKELSVICARNAAGEIKTFPPSENIHTHHILDFSIVPGRFPDQVSRKACQIATTIAEKIDLIGLLAVELFLLPDDQLFVNELAPRPHNSGHYSFDACVTSQFEQHVRAVCNLPLGETTLLQPVTMVNILGDSWTPQPPDWHGLLAHPHTKLHLYGKTAPKKGRKMGHFCVLAPSCERALQQAEELKKRFL